MILPNTLFARTGLTISLALLAFMLFCAFVILNYLLFPIAKQGSADFAALMVVSSKTWVELPPATRPDFKRELEENHGLILRNEPPKKPITPLILHSPYMLFLEDALSAQLGQETHVQKESGYDARFWVVVPASDRKLYFGFTHDRIGAEPPRAALIIILGASIFILITTLLLVRRITRPLARLAKGVSQLGSSGYSEPLPEKGPKELELLANKLNQLSKQVHQLLENRTTLLGGISHDLRSPLARLGVAIELLEGREDKELLERIRQDLAEMDQLIERTMELTKLMLPDENHAEPVDLPAFLEELAGAYSHQGQHVMLAISSPCSAHLDPMALRRVLCNLLDNAFRYTDSGDVELVMKCSKKELRICVLDEGPGIPVSQLDRVFQPFYRLDQSRNRRTGGSGLGLAIVNQLCDLHGWQVTLSSSPGKGLAACLIIAASARL